MTTTLTARLQDPTLIDLVDSLVEAIDTDRREAIARLREALAPFGAAALFDDELRLNGASSTDGSICVCEGWL